MSDAPPGAEVLIRRNAFNGDTPDTTRATVTGRTPDGGYEPVTEDGERVRTGRAEEVVAYVLDKNADLYRRLAAGEGEGQG